MSLDGKKITVFIPVRNGQDYIEDAINSVLRQTYKNLKIVIADNDSSDNTKNIIANYLKDKRVNLVCRQKDVGCVENFNKCLSAIDTEYYMMLSHDDRFYDNNALQIAVEILDKHSDVVAVHSDMMFIDRIGQPITRKKFGYSGLIDSDSIAKRSIVSGRNFFSIPLLIRTAAVGDLRFDASLPLSNDFDFSVALGQGKKVFHCPGVLLAIRFHGSNKTARIFFALESEFRKTAEKYNIKLSSLEKFLMKFNNLLVCMQKICFFFYLDKLRTYRDDAR